LRLLGESRQVRTGLGMGDLLARIL